MSIYSVITPEYEVDLCRSLPALLDLVKGEGAEIWDKDNPVRRPLDRVSLREALRRTSTINVFHPDDRDWTYKIQRHPSRLT